MDKLQALRKGLASLNRALDNDQFQEQIAKELLHLQNYSRERRQLLESLQVRRILYQQLLVKIQQRRQETSDSLMIQGEAIITDDLEALDSGILTIERELEAIESKREVMLVFEASNQSIDLSELDSATLESLRRDVNQ